VVRRRLVLIVCLLSILILSGCEEILDDQKFVGKKLGVVIEIENKEDLYLGEQGNDNLHNEMDIRDIYLDKQEVSMLNNELIEYIKSHTPMETVKVSKDLLEDNKVANKNSNFDYLLHINISDIKFYYESQLTEQISHSGTDSLTVSTDFEDEEGNEIEYSYRNNLFYELIASATGEVIISGVKSGHYKNEYLLTDSDFDLEGFEYELDYSDFKDFRVKDIKYSIIDALLKTDLYK